MSHKFLLLSVFLFISITSFSQGGIQFSAGLSKAWNKDAFITPESTGHYGYFVGADAALNDGKMYLLVGGQYHNLSFMPQADRDFFQHDENMKWFMLRFGLAFEIINLNNAFKLSLKTLGSINILSEYPKDLLASPYDNFNQATAGLLLGLNLEFKYLGVQFEYQNGLVNAVNQVEGTEFNYLSAGISFRI